MNSEHKNIDTENLVEYYHTLKAKYAEQPTPALKKALDDIGKEILDLTGEDDLSFIDPDVREEKILKNMPPEVPIN